MHLFQAIKRAPRASTRASRMGLQTAVETVCVVVRDLWASVCAFCAAVCVSARACTHSEPTRKPPLNTVCTRAVHLNWRQSIQNWPSSAFAPVCLPLTRPTAPLHWLLGPKNGPTKQHRTAPLLTGTSKAAAEGQWHKSKLPNIVRGGPIHGLINRRRSAGGKLGAETGPRI